VYGRAGRLTAQNAGCQDLVIFAGAIPARERRNVGPPKKLLPEARGVAADEAIIAKSYQRGRFMF
jgi:hypothetical protein